MSDPIDRQAVIDAVMDEFKRVPTNAIRAKTRIEALPYAQPDVHDTNVANIISLLSDMRSQYNCFNPDEEKCYRALSEAIKALTAQTEIIHCRDCKYYVAHSLFGRSQGWCERLCDEFDKSLARITEPEDYCSRAEPYKGEQE